MILKHGEVFINGHFEKQDIQIEDGDIVNIAFSLEGEEIKDCTGMRILPGLFDIHTHGCLGYDFSKSEPEQIEEMCRFYAKNGVTSILATTMSNEERQYHRAMGYIKQTMEKQRTIACKGQARIEGIHMEGPFFGTEKKGAHDSRYLRAVSQDLFEEYNQLSGNAIRLLDIDPVLPGAIPFIEKNRFIQEKKAGVTISLAHTSCTYEQAEVAVKAGASHVTHLFNSMRPMLHREPGLVGAAFAFGLDAEIICDGIHIHPAIVQMMFCAMPKQMILISDSINPTGLPDGAYTAGGLPIEVKGGKAFLEDHTLAGSTITLFDAVRNAAMFGVPMEQAILSATYYPAKSVHMEDRIGSIVVGRRADLLIVNDRLELCQVILNGCPL